LWTPSRRLTRMLQERRDRHEYVDFSELCHQ
jgi:hypothetical protein